jgi:hypothetical protein
MRKKIQTRSIKQTVALIGLGLCFSSGASYGDPIWSFLDGTDHEDILNSIDTPNNAFSAVPVDISFPYLGTLGIADEIEIRVSEATSINFPVSDILNYPNGDTGWHGANNTGAGLQTLSMTAGSVYFLATVSVQENTYKVIAKKQAGQDSYIGWLFSEVRQAPRPINDLVLEEGQNKSTTRRALAAAEEAAVSLTISAATEDGYYALIDKDLVWTFTVNNPLASATKALNITIDGKFVDDSLNIGGSFRDASDLFDLPANCQEVTYEETDPSRKVGEITCRIDPIAANSSSSIAIKSKVKAGLSVDSLLFGALGIPGSTLYEAAEGAFLATGNYSGYFSGPIPVRDVLTDTDADGISDFNEALLGTDSADINSGAQRDVIIDVVVLYTANFKEDISVDPETQINSAFTNVNEMYKGSNTGVKFNIVHYELLDYVNNCTAERCTPGQRWNDTLTVMAEYAEKDKKQWRFGEKIRALKGADYVAIIDGKNGDDETLGLAQSGVGNRGYFGLQKDKRTIFAHYDGNDSDNSDLTIAHELGHLLGISHSRKQSREGFAGDDDLASTLPSAAGHAVEDKFVTIMPYPDKFGFAGQIKRFSDSSRMDCDYTDPTSLEVVTGAACGISPADLENGADAVAAMKIVRYQHEQFSPSRSILPTQSSDGQTYSTKFLAGAIKDIEVGFKSEFLPTDKINAEGTINIAPEHVGEVGITHIILDGGALGMFQINSSGEFVAFAPALVGSISPRPLKAVEDLSVFNDLVFGNFGLTSATFNIFFGYTLTETNVTVYTGIPLMIKIGN